MKACIDIGGTKIAVCLSPAKADPATGLPPLLHRRTAPTPRSGAPGELARQAIALVDAACAEAGIGRGDLQAVGVSSCGPFLLVDGQIELAAPNICGGLAGPSRGLPNDWRSVPLQAPLALAFTNLRLENDGVAALEAERRWGALQGLRHCAYVTWSTGVGVGLCVDGRALHGKHGNAGHAGHMFVSDDASGALCGCGNVGDVEALVAGSALPGRFGLDAPALLQAAEAGDAAALAVVDELCRTLGRMLYNLTVTLDLERISIGGGVFWHHRRFLLPRLQAQISGRLAALTEGVDVVEAGLGGQVGDYAALALVSD